MAVKQLPRRAAGSKAVTWIGLTVTTTSGACIALGMEWIEGNLPYMRPICAVALFGGAMLTALGKSLTERRDGERTLKEEEQ